MIVELPTNDDERGQVGIGTLIIFIAMVLVAAVAAGVLINTAGLLESTASDTSQDSQAQVSNQISVISAVGDVENGEVRQVNLTVMKSAGSGDIDLANATVNYQSDDNSTTLTWTNESTASDGTNFLVYDTSGSVLSNEQADDLVLSETDERKVIEVDLSAAAIDDALQEGEEATLKVVDQSGASTIYGVNVPDTISDENYVAV
ncbi:archaellin/type IV pilin N-terminal domain-containing protein [Halorubellus sp. JP-L1]|uniref:archaellin/type IV pilin N-terminal domain-containing protein n=1 Tax=Halorubellus sp. JP-L1 TaxID=2715753 RepID=UPI001877CA56|nr:archaellin/type IV pilin N-terminal domain-containing protein [Halorubellus sp. JP-L1]